MLVVERGFYFSSVMYLVLGGGEDYEENIVGRESVVTEGRWRVAVLVEGRVWVRVGSGDVFVE